MKINETIKAFIRSWLNVKESNINNTMIIQTDDELRVEQLKNEIWYAGKPGELEQFYRQYNDYAGNSMFWRGQSSTGMPIRKIHTGLPKLIINKIADITVDDMSDVKFYSGKATDGKPIEDIEATLRWKEIAEEHDFKSKVLKKAVKIALLGDAVFKISYDSDISKYPIIEVSKGRDVDLDYKRGRFIGAHFYSHKLIEKKNYFLKESYLKKGVLYSLYDAEGRDVSAPLIEDLYDLYPFEYKADFIMAVPLIIVESSKHAGRGESILEGKEGAFDSFDETWSQWMDAIRAGRTNRYIPEEIIPRDPMSGSLMTPNAYDNQFIAIGSDKAEGAQNKISVESPDIRSDKYLAAYITALDMCLQGLISPSTLGIDVKKLDNAEAQREKEKTTLYTYQQVVERLEKVVPKLIKTVLQVDDVLNERDLKDYEVSVDFGGYANPSFEAKIETVGKGKQQGIISIERTVEELYGDSMTPDEKAEEVARLKREQGYDVEEPSMNTGVVGDFDGEQEGEDDVEDVQE